MQKPGVARGSGESVLLGVRGLGQLGGVSQLADRRAG